MTPIETFWNVTAPKLAEKWPDVVWIDKDGDFSQMVVYCAFSEYESCCETGEQPDLQFIHDIAEAIGAHVWASRTGANDSAPWTGELTDAEQCMVALIDGGFTSAPLAALAALNAAVQELTK